MNAGRITSRAARTAIVLCVVTVWATPSVAAARDDASTRARSFTGRVVVAPGREVYVECRGTGSPTVVLISGKGNGARDWHQVLDANDPIRDLANDEVLAGKGDLHDSRKAVLPTTARVTRVCTYDRPNTRTTGKARSTPRAQPHAVDDDVADLHHVLEKIGAPEPLVLVAHSYGGFVAELYARTYPDEVGGLVMVDAGSSYIARAVTAEKLGAWDRTNRIAAPGQESVEIADATAKLDAAPALRPIPSVVLTADKPLRADLQPVDADASVTFDDWLVGQGLLAKGLGAKQVTETNSGHNIYLYSPRPVNEAIREVVDDVRNGRGH
ncbi:MAG TPA: alpha/beta hydrolase [Acidimicrobiia bacterium]|jgi:pimeloyl-ACP methyl ester carboxylesterase